VRWPRTKLDPAVSAAYLRRLGLEPEPPSVAALHRLHRRQVERVPYETLWIAAGERWDLDPHLAARRVATEGRGGYCYHLNGAFSELLRSLGYEVHRHVGGVHGPEGPHRSARGNHLVLTVSGLPNATNPAGVWYLDAGLGDAMHAPLPLAPGAYRQGPFRLTLEQTARGWHLTHDPRGGFTGMAWDAGAARLDAFAAQHEWLSTSPESGFVQVPMAERRDAKGVDVIRGLVLCRIGSGARTDEPLQQRADYFAVLADVFGLGLDHMPRPVRDRLWKRVTVAHRAWEAAGRP